MAGFKKPLMLLVWRFQQINSLVIIVGLSLTLSLQLFRYVDWRFYNLGFTKDQDWLIMLIIFVIVFSGAVIVGIIYDTILKLWIEQNVVITERQPYAKEKLAPKGILNREFFFIPLLRKADLNTEADFATKWVERNLDQDPILRKDAFRVIDWINEHKLKPEDKRWLKDLEKIVKKPYAPKTKDVIKK